MVKKRPVFQDKFEKVKPNEERTRPTTEEEWLYEYRKEEFYVNREKELKEKAEEKERTNLGGGFSKDMNKSGREKRKKWDKNANNAIMPMSVDQKLNSKTAAQLDRLANIQIEASKQDMIINEMYTQVKHEQKQTEELKNHIKPKKDKVKREAPVPNVPRSGLFSVDNWLSQINEADPEKKKQNKATKKLNVKKVNEAVERLSKPSEPSKSRRDPDQDELKAILSKYDTSEVRIGGGGKKKFEYINPVPGSTKKSPIVARKNIKYGATSSQKSTNEGEASEEDYSQYQLSRINQEEAKLRQQKKQLDTIMTHKSQLNTNKISEHNTMVDNAFNEILGESEDSTLVPVPKQNQDENEDDDEDLEPADDQDFGNDQGENDDDFEDDSPAKVEFDKDILDNLKYIKEKVAMGDQSIAPSARNDTLQVPDRSSQLRASKDSLNDRVELNGDLDMIDEQSDYNERDIDLEQQYEEMIGGKGIEDIEEESDNDSLNDVDEDLTNMYTGM